MNGYRRRWLTLVMVLSGGMLLQAPTACQTLVSDALIGVTTSITSAFIENAVFEAFGLGGLNTSLGSTVTSGLLTGSGLSNLTNPTGTGSRTGTTGLTGTTGSGTTDLLGTNNLGS